MCPRVFHYQHRLPGNQNKITDVCPSLPQTRSFPWPQLGVLPAEYGMRVHLVEYEYFIPTVKVNREKTLQVYAYIIVKIYVFKLLTNLCFYVNKYIFSTKLIVNSRNFLEL